MPKNDALFLVACDKQVWVCAGRRARSTENDVCRCPHHDIHLARVLDERHEHGASERPFPENLTRGEAGEDVVDVCCPSAGWMGDSWWDDVRDVVGRRKSKKRAGEEGLTFCLLYFSMRRSVAVAVWFVFVSSAEKGRVRRGTLPHGAGARCGSDASFEARNPAAPFPLLALRFTFFPSPHRSQVFSRHLIVDLRLERHHVDSVHLTQKDEGTTI